jgi:pSer/pThr/pTyr-binding forkhead associated (FHA) protein
MRRDDVGRRREPLRPVLRWVAPSGRTEEVALSNARPATIGRDDTCTIVLDSRLVSKAHALVEFRDGEYTIQDLQSANGTRVNGEATAVRVLEPGDRIEVGDVELTFVDLQAAAGGGAAAPAGGAKVVRLAMAGAGTLIVTVGLMFALIGGGGEPAPVQSRAPETLAPAPPETLARLKQGAASAPVVTEVVQYATLAGVPPAQALQDEGRLRLETGRWRDAAFLLAATVARDPANTRAAAAFEQAAAQLERAASRALADAELAEFGMRYQDALLHADAVLLLVDRQDPRYDRALKIAETARASARTAK